MQKTHLPEKLPATNIKHYYYMIETGLIETIQKRRLSIRERLFAVYQVLGRLESLNGSLQMVKTIKQVFSLNYQSLGLTVPDYELHLELLRQAFVLIKKDAEVKESIGSLFKVLAAHGNVDAALDILRSEDPLFLLTAKKYEEQLQWYYSLSQEKANWVWENYFVNYIFTKEFYVNEWDEALFKMALIRSVVQFYAVSLQVLCPNAEPEKVLIHAIMEIDILISHNEVYVNELWKNVYKKLYPRTEDVILNFICT